MKSLATLYSLLLQFRSGLVLYAMLLLFTVTGILEIVAIGTIAPFFALLIGGGDTPDHLSFLFDDQDSHIKIISQIGLISGIAIVCSNAFRMLNLLASNYYSWSFQKYLSERLLKIFVTIPYLDFIQGDIGEMKRAILNDSLNIASGVLSAMLALISNAVVILLITIFLMYQNIMGTSLLIIIVFSLFGGIAIATRRFLNEVGGKKIKADAERIALVDLLLQNLKQITAIKKLALIIDQYELEATNFARYNAYQQIFKTFPRLIFEAAFFPILIAMSLFQFNSTAGASSDLLEFYALFAFAALRIFPLVSIVFQSVTQIIFNIKALEGIKRIIEKESEVGVSDSYGNAPKLDEIRLRDVTFTYPSADIPVVSNFSETFHSGNWYRFVGDSGRGKTTLIDIACGLIPPSSGSVDLITSRLSSVSAETVFVGYASQRPVVINDTVLFNITLERDYTKIDWQRLNEVIEVCACTFIGVGGLHSPVGIGGAKYSGGQIQRLCLARVLYLDPPLYIFDEITSNLDEHTARTVMNNLEHYIADKIIFFVSHQENAMPGSYTTINMDQDCL